MTSKVESAMRAGVRGELLRGVGLVQSARKNDVPFVVGIYGGAAVISAVFGAFLMNPAVVLFVDLLMYAVWAAIAYVFVAIGTRLSHNLATWGIALVAGIIAVVKSFGNLSGALMGNTMNAIFAGTDFELPGTGGYVFRMVLFGALSVGCFYLVVVMSRAMKVMSPSPPAFPPPHAEGP